MRAEVGALADVEDADVVQDDVVAGFFGEVDDFVADHFLQFRHFFVAADVDVVAVVAVAAGDVAPFVDDLAFVVVVGVAVLQGFELALHAAQFALCL